MSAVVAQSFHKWETKAGKSQQVRDEPWLHSKNLSEAKQSEAKS